MPLVSLELLPSGNGSDQQVTVLGAVTVAVYTCQ